eukprot:68781_1
MHALQKQVQMYGKISYELKTKSKSLKLKKEEQVEYLIRCERLKELIVCGKMELPVVSELITRESRRDRERSLSYPLSETLPPSLSLLLDL